MIDTPRHTIITIPDPADCDCQGDQPDDRRSSSYADDKARMLTRLRRIEGQIRGIQRMVEEDRYCIDILTQISAVISSAQSVGLVMLEDHIRGCVVGAAPDEQEERLLELNKAIERFTRSVR